MLRGFIEKLSEKSHTRQAELIAKDHIQIDVCRAQTNMKK